MELLLLQKGCLHKVTEILPSRRSRSWRAWPPATVYSFRLKTVTNNGPSEWSSPVTIATQ